MSLIVKNVSKRFDATQALDSIDLEVQPGEVVALLGENGAGKSTLSNIIAGTFAPDTGTMQWQGHTYAPAAPGDAIAAGIGMIHQELRLLPDLSVAENVFVGRWPMKGGRVDRDEMNARAAAQLQRLGLDISPERKVRTLRVAAQQQVEIAKALTLEAKLLLLDEPTAALGAEETEHLFAVIDQLRAEGVSFIYVSHRLEEIARIADRVVVLRDGRWVASHDSAQVPVSQLIEDMVGRNLERLFPAAEEPGSAEVLQVDGLTGNGFRDVSFAVRAGEILGIAGIVGAGRTELVRAIAGADPVPRAPSSSRARRSRSATRWRRSARASRWSRRTARTRASCSTCRSRTTSPSRTSTGWPRAAGSSPAACARPRSRRSPSCRSRARPSSPCGRSRAATSRRS